MHVGNPIMHVSSETVECKKNEIIVGVRSDDIQT